MATNCLFSCRILQSLSSPLQWIPEPLPLLTLGLEFEDELDLIANQTA